MWLHDLLLIGIETGLLQAFAHTEDHKTLLYFYLTLRRLATRLSSQEPGGPLMLKLSSHMFGDLRRGH